MLVVASLVPALVLAGFLFRRVTRENREALDRRLLDAARAQATVVDAELTGSMRALQALALSPEIARGDLAGFREEAIAFQKSQPSWYRIILIDRNGRQVVNTAYPVGVPLPELADRESVDEMFARKEPIIGNLRRGNGRERLLAFTVRVPVWIGGEPRFALTAAILPTSLVDIIQRQAPVTDVWSRGIVDNSGTVIARTPDPDTFVGRQATAEFLAARPQREGVMRNTALDGSRVYSAFATAPVSGWMAGVAVPEGAVDAVASQSLMQMAGSALALLAVGGFFAFVISRRISTDIEAAAVAADDLVCGREPEVPRSSVTEVRRLSVALRRSAAMLEARERERDEHIARANQTREAADKAREAAESANQAKDEFLATLGHELRNPLAPALTALHLMRLRGDTGGKREREIIERQVQHLARLVDDLLDVSRARAGRLEIRRHPFELIHAIEVAVEIAGPLIALRGHKLTLDMPRSGMVVNGDETRLAQVFGNLLNNAAKHSDRAGEITLRGFVEGNEIVVVCSDTGQGIDDELLPRIFDHFSQGAQSIARQQGGLGLGLAVVKMLVELHGGTVTASSPGIGRGSTFTVRLPRAELDAVTTGETTSSDTAPLDRRRVLVVDDNYDSAEMIAEMLRMRGFNVAVAHDGLSALRVNTDFQADIAVLDIGLPTMDGLEVARRMRDAQNGRRLRLIAMTGYGQASDVEASRAAGFDIHLVKPVVAEKLFEAIGGG